MWQRQRATSGMILNTGKLCNQKPAVSKVYRSPVLQGRGMIEKEARAGWSVWIRHLQQSATIITSDVINQRKRRWKLYAVSKNVTTLSHYNSDKHESIRIIFGVSVNKKVSSRKVLHFPTSHNYTVAIKRSQLIFVCKFFKNQRILMQSLLLDLKMNGTCDGIVAYAVTCQSNGTRGSGNPDT